MTEPFVTCGTFTIERTYDEAPAQVFNAHADPAIKRRWLVEGEGFEVDEFTSDFRVGGLETSRFRFQGGEPMRTDTVYQDIVQDRRIVIAYTMSFGEKRISSSLATIEFKPAGFGTRLVFTEYDVFLDGQNESAGRKEGTQELLEALARELKSHAK